MNFKPSLSQLFSTCAPFRGIAADDVADIVSRGGIHVVPRDRPVFEQGLDAIAFYLLVEGYVRVIKVQPDGEQVVLRYFPAGELIGIAPAMDLKIYPATAIAAIDCVVMAWPSRLWDEFGARHPMFLANVLRTVGTRLQASQERLIEISTKRAEQRVALALLHIGETVGRPKDGGFTIDFPISRQDIAEMTAATLHTVSRLLAEWERAVSALGGNGRSVLATTALRPPFGHSG